MSNLTELETQVFELNQEGVSNKEIANRIGKSYYSVKDTLKRARRKLRAEESPGVMQAASDLGLDLNNLKGGWLKGDNASLLFSMPKEEDEEHKRTYEELVEVFREDIKPLPRRDKKPTSTTNQKLLTKYVLPDLHFGMYASLVDTGNEYNLEIAEQLLRDSVSNLIHGAPNSRIGYLLILGDVFHCNDSKNETPESGHRLDTHGTFLEIGLTVSRAIRSVVDRLLEKHDEVLIGNVPGNHDKDQAHWLSIALQVAYENEPRVKINPKLNEKMPSKAFGYRHGKNLLLAHHGDKTNYQRLYNWATTLFSKELGQTEWNFFDTGHIHHSTEQEIGGFLFRSYRTIAAKDAYSAHAPYTAKRSMVAQTYHEDAGEIYTNRVNLIDGNVPNINI